MRKLLSPSRRATIITAITLTAVGAATVGFMTSASASPRHASQKADFWPCSLATLHGDYLFHGDGTNIANGVSTALAYAGSFAFDGEGNLSGYISTDVNGQVQSDRPFTGTYTLNANCTGSYTVTSNVHVPVLFDIFAAPSGDMFTYMQTGEPGASDFDVDATSAVRVALG